MGSCSPDGRPYHVGANALQIQLENELAAFVKKEAALLINFGFQGVVSIIDAVLDRHDVVVYDKDSHACIYDGVRFHLGKRLPFEHNDIESFEKQIKKARLLAEQSGGGVLVITEGVFGMRGEQGIIKEIVSLTKRSMVSACLWTTPTVSARWALRAPAPARNKAYKIRLTFTSAPLPSQWRASAPSLPAMPI
jgi:7-keto-8-aminopelargonate synthetase-like enzyme